MTTSIGQHRFHTLGLPSLSEAPSASNSLKLTNYLKLLNDEIARAFNPLRSVADGGTGTDTFVLGDLLYADAANSLARRAIGGAGTVLTVSGGVPAWVASTLSALTDVTITAVADQQTLRYDAGTAQWINESVLKVGVADVTLSGAIIMTTAASRLIPGATSLAFRNTANSADNLLIADAGGVTLRTTLTFATAASQIIPGATSFSLRNNANSADNLLISNAGDATLRLRLLFATAASKIVPGATSISLRNTADSADNLLISDAGALTLRGAMSGGTTLSLAGPITLTTAASRIIPGATSFAVRNTGNTVDNLLIVDAGNVTIGTDPGGTGTVRVGGAIDMTGAINMRSTGTLRWTTGISGLGGYQMQSAAGAADTHVYFVDSSGTPRAQVDTVNGAISHKDTTLLHTGVALTNGAAAAAGTLTNAPVAGNPTKWIPVDDNGTTRYIPAW